MTGDLQGRTAVVTGGANGIGHAISLKLARAGARIVVADLQLATRPGGYEERPDLDIVALIRAEGGEALFVQTDVTRADQVRQAAAAARENFGGLDIWVNNAGIVAPQKSLLDYEDSEYERCLAVNSGGVWNGLRAAIAAMVDQGRGGVIVNLLSTAALRPHEGQSIYDISKAAAAAATRCAALEYAHAGIRVNAVCPTIVKTGLTKGFAETPEFQAWVRGVLPMGELADTQQVADAVHFLAGDASRAMTGVLMPVDMGEMLGAPQKLKMG